MLPKVKSAYVNPINWLLKLPSAHKISKNNLKKKFILLCYHQPNHDQPLLKQMHNTYPSRLNGLTYISGKMECSVRSRAAF